MICSTFSNNFLCRLVMLTSRRFKARYNTMIVFLFRPSPQVPEPSIRAAQLCFEASRFNINIQREQISTKSVDLTWIFTQSLFMAINTLLWALSYPDIRKDHPRPDVEQYLQTALEGIYLASKKWPGVESALELYTTLADACLKAYDGGKGASYRLGSPVNKAVAASPQSIDTPPPVSTPSAIYSTLTSSQQVSTSSPPTQFAYAASHNQPQSDLSTASLRHNNRQSLELIGHNDTLSRMPLSEYVPGPDSHDIPFSTSFDNPLPSPITYGYSSTPLANMYDRNFLLGTMGDQYAQYLHNEYISQEPMDGLNLEQQSELMNNLEMNGLNGPITQTSPGASYQFQ